MPLAAAFAFRGMARVADAKISALAPVKVGRLPNHLEFDPAKDEEWPLFVRAWRT